MTNIPTYKTFDNAEHTIRTRVAAVFKQLRKSEQATAPFPIQWSETYKGPRAVRALMSVPKGWSDDCSEPYAMLDGCYIHFGYGQKTKLPKELHDNFDDATRRKMMGEYVAQNIVHELAKVGVVCSWDGSHFNAIRITGALFCNAN